MKGHGGTILLVPREVSSDKKTGWRKVLFSPLSIPWDHTMLSLFRKMTGHDLPVLMNDKPVLVDVRRVADRDAAEKKGVLA